MHCARGVRKDLNVTLTWHVATYHFLFHWNDHPKALCWRIRSGSWVSLVLNLSWLHCRHQCFSSPRTIAKNVNFCLDFTALFQRICVLITYNCSADKILQICFRRANITNLSKQVVYFWRWLQPSSCCLTCNLEIDFYLLFIFI